MQNIESIYNNMLRISNIFIAQMTFTKRKDNNAIMGNGSDGTLHSMIIEENL